ncbi:putative amidophosphoribosyltransferase/ketosteroid isomerase-like protein [Desulfofundulus luciae]|uniref:Amidophosphoribosyltransferase/ketosteroid isomerase-like protein n=1 Tax=Desulfofundulus luciae TaxID=74702 RepID=A0ABU0B4U0_9FIRM|nr:zinc ribbon domain-containing protein [Desulfofundulus luciae]MDQ0287731.1 putative amidophosphoribosyltransferase/ketosteroid isomerase-like protein [Desulfofundulus luciae]
MILCPECKKEVDKSKARFCPHCGASLLSAGAKACPNCGALAGQGARFCGKCGFSLEAYSDNETYLGEDSFAAPEETVTMEPVEVTCPYCGTLMQAGKKFCRKCGRQMGEPGDTSTLSYLEEIPKIVRPVELSPKPSARRRIILWLIPLFVIVTVISAAAYAYLQGYVLDKQPPEVSISAPAWNKVLTLSSSGEPVQELIEIKARDNRVIKKIDLLINGVPTKATENSNTLIYQWETSKEGKYTFCAVARDRCGNTGKSLPIMIEVKSETELPEIGLNDDLDKKKQEISDIVYNWVNTIREKNLIRHMDFYADVLELYYTSPNLSKVDVYKDKEETMAKFDVIDMSISDLQINIENNGIAYAVFNKKWDAKGRETFSGEVLQQLKLKNINGKWQIVGEEELKIYWVIRNGKKIV